MQNIEHLSEIIYKTKLEWSMFFPLWAKHENYDDIELKHASNIVS